NVPESILLGRSRPRHRPSCSAGPLARRWSFRSPPGPSHSAGGQTGRSLTYSRGFPKGAEMLRDRLRDWISQLAALAAVILVGIIMTILSPYFLTYRNLSAVAVQGSVTAIIAVGMTLVIVTAGIDLSVGSAAALTGVLGALLMVNAQLSWPVASLCALVIGGGIGLVNGALVGWARLAPFIATLGMMGVARGLTFISTGAVAVYGLPDGFAVLGQGNLGPVPVPAVCLIAVIIVFSFLFNRTKLGRYAYAIGSNENASRLVGIPVRRYLVMVYVAQGVLAGFGGIIATSRVASGQPNFGIGLELDAIAAAVIGGRACSADRAGFPAPSSALS